MQQAFIAVLLVSGATLLLRRRPFDGFTVAYGAAAIYFIPGLAGYARYPTTWGSLSVELEPATYAVFVTVVASIALSAWLFDGMRLAAPAGESLSTERSGAVALVVVALAAGLAAATSGRALLDPDKDVVLDQLNRWYILGAAATALLAVYAFSRRRRLVLAVAAVAILVDIYVGFRDTFAFVLIAIALLHLGARPRASLLRVHWKAMIAFLFSGTFLFIYKQFAAVIKHAQWNVLVENAGNAELYVEALVASEPFTTQAILNETLAQDFRVGVEHMLNVANNFMLFSNELGIVAESFNSLFQPALFPSVPFGMANNIWAEMLASGGWLLLLAFVVAFNFVLGLLSWLARSRNPEIAGTAAVLLAEWAFYIHRNDLTYQVTIMRRTVLIAAGCIMVSMLMRRSSPAHAESPPAQTT